MALITSYSEANVDAYHEIQANHPSGSGSASARGMAFTTPAGLKYTLTSAKFYLKKIGSPTGNVTAQLFASTGTVGTDAAPTGSVLATSDNVDVSGFLTEPALITFTLSTPYEMDADTDYCIVFVNPGSGIDGDNYPSMGVDESSPTYSGNRLLYNLDSGWYGTSLDYAFYVYGDLEEVGGSFLLNFV